MAKVIAQLWQRDRAKLSDDFKGYLGHFEAKFQVKGLLFAPVYLWTVRQGNGYTTTLPLEVFAQRNFVADIIRLKMNFIQKAKKSLFEPPFGDLEGTVRTSSIARWQPTCMWSTSYSS